MKISISLEQILMAVRKNSHRCMIAEAIKEAEPHARRIVVDLQSIRWTDDQAGVRYSFFTPPIAQEALLAFDQGEEVEPFTFELRSPASIRPQGVEPSMEKTTEKHKGKHRRGKTTEPEPRVRKIMEVTKRKQQVKLRETEREFGICRVKEHPLKKKESK